MSNQYTDEQVADIKDREAKGLAALKELQLTPAAQMYAVNVGNDAFGVRPVCFLQDTKYTSPIQAKDV